MVAADEFAQSMPETYRRVFDRHSISEHAEIVERRRGRTVHIERWRTLPGGLVVLCVVATDRAGLLSAVAAALAGQGLTVVSAQIYTRGGGLEEEAVDFFWVELGPTLSSLDDEAVERLTASAERQLSR